MEGQGDINELIQLVMGLSKNIRRQLGPGYLESVYKNAMVVELRNNRIPFELEVPIHVFYEGVMVGNFKADIVVDCRLILELKAVQALTLAHEIQLVNYLTATKVDDGLLINFGADQLQFKRKFRLYTKQQ
jgi:GxxExxY protein